MKQAALIASLLMSAALYLSAQTVTRSPTTAVPAHAPAPAPGTLGPGNVPLTAPARPPAALTNGFIGQTRLNTNALMGAHSNITPVQMQNINLLDQEMARLPIPGANAAESRRQLIETLQAAPVAGVQPSPESIVALGTTLATVVPSLTLLPNQRRQLAIDLNLALNSGNLSPMQAERVVIDARTLLQTRLANNPRGVETLIGDLSTMVGEVQGRLGQTSSSSTAETADDHQEQAPPPAPVGQSAVSQAGQGSGASPGPSTTSPTR
jgi:hypothetical protein